MAGPDPKGVLARWSRRKQAARHGRAEEDEPAAAGPLPAAPEEAAPPPAEADAEAAEPAPELPDPDSLDDPGAFKAFMAKGVPPELRSRALRRLWRLDPIYSHHDGLDDYCGDYTDGARVVRNLKTAYRVGRGFLKEVAKEVARAEEPAAPPGTGEPGPAADGDPKPALTPAGSSPEDRRHPAIAARREGGDVAAAGPTAPESLAPGSDLGPTTAPVDDGVAPGARDQLSPPRDPPDSR